MLGNGLVSLASFGLAISVARASPIVVFAEFSLAMVCYLFILGAIRAALTETTLATPDDVQKHRETFQRVMLVSLVTAAGLACWGFIVNNPYILLLSLTLHGLMALDFIRVFDSALGNWRRSFFATLIWVLATMTIILLSFVEPLEPRVLFGGWAGVGALIGYGLMIITRASWAPKWVRDEADTRVAAVFAADYLVGSGGSLLTTGLLGLLQDGRSLVALRGAGTLLGPLNLIAVTARSLMLPVLARREESSGQRFRLAAVLGMLQVLILLPLLVALQFIPTAIGEALLGETWTLAQLALLPMSLEALFALIGAIASAGHRVAFAGARSLILRTAVGLPRPFIVLWCAFQWGIAGAAWSMAVIAILNAFVWWLSFYGLTRVKHRDLNEPG